MRSKSLFLPVAFAIVAVALLPPAVTAQVYPWTLIDYSYAKILLAPGLRLGYLAICPDMPQEARDELRQLATPTQSVAMALAASWGYGVVNSSAARPAEMTSSSIRCCSSRIAT